MNVIIAHLKSQRPNLAENTYVTYARSILRLRKISADFEPPVIDKYLQTLTATTARNLLTALVVYDGRDVWSRRHEKYNTLAVQHRDQQSLSDYESARWTTWKRVVAAIRRMKQDCENQKLFVRKAITASDYRLLSGYVAMSIHKYFQWRNDVPSIRVVETTADAGKGNCYIKSLGRFVLREFKTAKFFRRRRDFPVTLDAPKPLRAVLHKFIKHHGSEWLLPQFNGKKTSKNSFKGLLQHITYRYLGLRLGTTMLRKIYLTEFLSTDPRLTDRKRVLRNMLQLNLEQQFQYRRRVEPFTEKRTEI